MSVKGFLQGVLTSLLLLLTGVVLVTQWLHTPEVYFTAVTKQCVRVVPQSAGSCDALPHNYTVVWVSEPEAR